MKIFVILTSILLSLFNSCNTHSSTSYTCGEIVYNEQKEVIHYVECDSSIEVIKEYTRINNEHYIQQHYNYKLDIMESYDNDINQHLKYRCKYGNKEVFAIDRYPQYIIDESKEILKGDCIISLPNNTNNGDKKFFITYPSFADSVFLYAYRMSDKKDWVSVIGRHQIINRKVVLAMDSSKWKMEILMYLNSGRLYKFTKELSE